MVLPYIDMNPPRVYTSSQSWIPLPPPTPYHLSGSSPCTSPKHPVSCIEHRLALRFLHDSIYVSMPFSQVIPPSSSPSESKSPFYTCLFCCLAYRVIITIFLNSVYMCQYTVLVFFFLAYFTLYNWLQFHPSQNWFKCILFKGWVILHGVYVLQLSYPFICWWTSRLLRCPGYYKQCCDEHWGTCVTFYSDFLGVYAQQWDCWVIRQLYLQFFKESPHCFP